MFPAQSVFYGYIQVDIEFYVPDRNIVSVLNASVLFLKNLPFPYKQDPGLSPFALYIAFYDMVLRLMDNIQDYSYIICTNRITITLIPHILDMCQNLVSVFLPLTRARFFELRDENIDLQFSR